MFHVKHRNLHANFQDMFLKRRITYRVMNAEIMYRKGVRGMRVRVPYTARLVIVTTPTSSGRFFIRRGTLKRMSILASASHVAHRAQDACTWMIQVNDHVRDSWKARSQRTPAEKTTSKDIFLLSMPLFIELFMQLMVGNVNQMMLAPQGSHPAAAVGNALQILNIITIALSAMGTASTVLVTRVLGNHTVKRSVSEIATVALIINIVLSVVITVVLFTCWPLFFRWLHIDPSVHGMASSFLLIVGSTTLIQGSFFAVTALLRSYARVGNVMVAGLVMNAVNIGASLILVNGLGSIPAWGVEGAAAANVLSRLVGLALALRMLIHGTEVRPSFKLLKPFPWKTLKQMLRVGIPSSGEQLNYDVAQIVILSFVNVLGTTVVTVKIYCSLIASIAYLYSIALSQATQIVLGYLFGAGKFNAVRKRVWMADLIAATLTTAMSLMLWLNFDAVMGLFTTDPVVLELGRQIMLVEVFLGIGRSLNIVMVRVLIALGDVRTPVAVNVAFSWVFAVGGGWLLGFGLGWGLVGMWIAMCIDEWLRAAFLLITFARGGWRRRAENGRLDSKSKSEVKQDDLVGVNAPAIVGLTALDGAASSPAEAGIDLTSVF